MAPNNNRLRPCRASGGARRNCCAMPSRPNHSLLGHKLNRRSAHLALVDDAGFMAVDAKCGGADRVRITGAPSELRPGGASPRPAQPRSGRRLAPAG